LAVDHNGVVTLAIPGYSVPYINNNSYLVVVSCSNGSSVVDTASFTFTRLSRNEFSPQLLHDASVSITIPENFPQHEVVADINATDNDIGQYGTLNYQIVNGNIGNVFSINSINGRIALIGILNYTSNNMYTLLVQVSNVYDPIATIAQYVEAVVVVNLLAVPKFDYSVYTASVPETGLSISGVTYPRPTLGFITVSCTDADTPADDIVYTITSFSDVFQINTTTGQLEVIRDLDYDNPNGQFYQFEAVCTDGSSSDSALLQVTVVPINEHRPMIRINDLPLVSSASETDYPKGTVVISTSSSNKTIGWVSAVDDDLGADGELSFVLVSTHINYLGKPIFGINATTGQVFIMNNVDTDGTNFNLGLFSFRIGAYDESGAYGQSNRVLMLIEGASDELPMFTSEAYFVTEPEDIPVHSSLVYARCTDRDTDYGLFDYISIVNESYIFSLNNKTGEIRLISPLDYETQQVFILNLICYDTVGNYDTAVVYITVAPVNDEIPYFSNETFTFEVSQTTPHNLYFIGTVMAYDDDLGYGSNLTYSLVSDYFIMTPSIGNIYLTQSLLHVSDEFLQYNVTVSDDNNLHVITAAVIFEITPGNYQPPSFTSDDSVIEISELTPIGSTVFTVNCNDSETGENGEVSYLILSGNIASAFSVVSSTGAVKVANSLILPKNVTSANYFLELRCYDHGVPPLFATTVLPIKVLLANTFIPDISNDTIVAFVNEDTGPTNVVTIMAMYFGDTPLVFSLLHESVKNAFSIFTSDNAGVVYVNSTLDRERIDTYTMTVVASAPNNMNDSAVLFIYVRDVNDNSPNCNLLVVSLQVPETTEIGDEIYNLNCSDADTGQNANLTYSLNNDYNIIGITLEGSVYLTNHLNSTNSSTLSILVTVSDQGLVVQRSVTINFILNIVTTNKFVPEFTNLPSSLNISESVDVFLLPVFTVEATDMDKGIFGIIRYSLIDQSNLPFIIIPNTGELYLIEKLNYHVKDSYMLNISVTDATYTTYSTLDVNVIDANEYSPVCVSTFISRQLFENIPVTGIEPISLGCTDNDDGPYGTLTYEIISGNVNNDFTMSANGFLSVANVLDYEVTQSYNITVRVSDMGNPPLHETVTIHISVAPVNEYSPVIHDGPYSVAILENSQVGVTIFHVNASDQDADNDGRLNYALTPEQTAFGITDNGSIVITGSLDREVMSNYSLTVVVNDQATISKTTTTLMTIYLLDIDDSPPQFVEDLCIFVVFSENASIGNGIGSCRCVDPDEGENSAFTYSLDSSTDSSYFTVSPEGNVIVNDTLPLSSIYSFYMYCTGTLNPNYTDTAIVSITIEVQSNITFQNSPYIFPVLESTQPVFTIGVINGTSNTGTALTYSLVNSPHLFQISDASGELRLVGELDYETNQSHVFAVKATDSGMPPNSGLVAVNVLVENVNDGLPTFTTSVTNLMIVEERDYILPLGAYVCSDTDDGIFGDITYSILSGDINSTFVIDEVSGHLYLKKTIDYESVMSSTLFIQCSDGGDPPFNSTKGVSVVVQPVNEFAPQFSSSEVSLTIDESLSVPTLLTLNNEIQATDADSFPHNQIWYSIVSGNDDQVFAISSSTGSLNLIKNLDFETVPNYDLVIQADDGGGSSNPGYTVLTSTVQVHISISDANDHSPFFNKNIYVGSIAELAEPGDYVKSLTLNCTDLDSGANGQTVLTIESGNVGGAFSILSNGRISVNNTLDFEVVSTYYLTVRCSDQGNTPRIDEATVIITVEDVSEFGPEFQSPYYEFFVNETETFGYILGSVSAIDQDTGSTGSITYAINNLTNIPFAIHSGNGEIYVVTPLDYESGLTVFNLTVIAYDSVNQSDVAIVVVTLINVDESVPVFTASNYYGTIRESLPPGMSIDFTHPISCTDADDAADSLTTSLYLTPSTGSAFGSDFPFNIQETTGVITSLSMLDLESVDRYIFKVLCRDRNGNNATASVTVDLLPYNDFSPIFSGTPYVRNISEGITQNSLILTVSATDDDLLSYNTILFSIESGNDNGVFSIDPINGIIRNIQDVDYEQQSQYMLNISARNIIPAGDTSGSPSLSSYTNAVINVIDVNDNSPIIIPPSATAVVRVEDGPGTHVITMSCEDSDSGSYGETLMFLSGPSANKFNLLNNGTIVTLENITSELVLIVNCTDMGMPQRYTTAQITISTTSSNDHAPVFSETVKHFYVLENATVGQSIGCHPATDDDGSLTPDGILTYTLFHVFGPNHFYVNELTGCLVLAAALDYDDANLYTYRLRAQDGGIPQRYADATLVINIINVVIDPPVFTQSSYSRNMSEGTPPGAIVQQNVICTDRDDGDIITYAIIGGNDAGIFTINETTGLIRLATSLDYEVTTLHSLEIQCTDSTNLNDVANLTISVTPVNEHTPVILPKTVTVNEQSPVGTPITVLDFVDLDSGIDGEVVFEIINPQMSEFFVIVDHTVYFNSILDREIQANYSLDLRITDLAIINRTSEGGIKIVLNDINDNSPLPEKPIYTRNINETLPVNSLIYTFSCADIDVGANAEIQYTVEENSLFVVDADNGSLLVASDLRFRDSDIIVLDASCRDKGVPALSTSFIAQIQISSINYYSPSFINDSFSVTLLEDYPLLTPFANVTAVDEDVGLNGRVTYRLINDYDNRFYIDQLTGEISLLIPLDFETVSYYALTVEAIDGYADSLHMNRKSDMLNITLIVSGVNEHTPICTRPLYTAYINQTFLGHILTLNCTDSDNGIDGVISYSYDSTQSNFINISSNGEINITSIVQPDPSILLYEVIVVVSDNGVPRKNTTIEVNFIYSFDNIEKPKFTNSTYSLTIPELTSIGSVVYTFIATDSDPGIQGQISYSVQNTDYVRIDPNSGELFVSEPLDWETSKNFTFQVVATDGDPFMPNSASVDVTVSVLDENDNSPICSQYFDSIFINSDVNPGDAIFNAGTICSDSDGPLHSILQYDLRPSGAFIINSTGSVLVNSTLQPSTTSVLTLTVTNEGAPVRSVNITLTVQVRFINNFPPEFSSPHFYFNTSEDTEILSVIGMVQAQDDDVIATSLEYSFLTSVDGFYIDPSLGEIILTDSLNYEETTMYNFTIVVKDEGDYDGSNILSSTAKVTVTIDNTNDNYPVLNNNGIYGATVNKTTPIGTHVIAINCSDGDAYPYAGPFLVLSPYSDVAPFNLSSQGGTGSVVVSQDLTLINGSSSYVLNVTCFDQGGNSDTGLVYLSVPDSDGPVFNASLYEWSLPENSENGVIFSSIYAMSQDNSDITYSITDGNMDGMFYINPQNGWITLTSSLDYENQMTYALVVTATDGSNRRTSTLLLITVLDVDDITPLVSPSAFMTVHQYRSPNYPIGSVRCTDEDSEPLNISFKFHPPTVIFRIDSGGIIYLNQTLDATPVYVLPVVCYDVAVPETSSTGIVTIQVIFTNLYQPQFDYNIYHASVPEDIAVQSEVTSVHATDADVGSFGELSYSIAAGNPEKFYIESQTGAIHLLTSLDREDIDEFTLTVHAVDGSNTNQLNSTTLKTGTTTVIIDILDINDNAPMFNSPSYTQFILTNHSVLSNVLQVQCTDPDLSENGTITYSILPPHSSFIIDSNGTIILSSAQTVETVHNFHVFCQDMSSVQHQSSSLVSVVVQKVDFSSPVFQNNLYEVTIPEDQMLLESFAQVRANTSDSEVMIYYSITEGNSNNTFAINSLSGEIYVIRQLDYSEDIFYSLTVKASTSGFVQYFSYAVVNIYITDVNNNDPYFVPTPLYTATVNESAEIYTPIVQVQCIDADPSSTLTYRLTGVVPTDGLAKFNVTESGFVIVQDSLDYETTTFYSVSVECSDGGASPATGTVLVNIGPINEYRPLFLKNKYDFIVNENAEIGSTIGNVTAVDYDSGNDGEILYLLQDPGSLSPIFIEPSSGNVLISNVFDYETTSFYDLSIIARDRGGRESYVPLEITVVNLQDVPPILTPAVSIFNGRVLTTSPQNYFIQSCNCIDPDGNSTSIGIAGGNDLGLFSLNEYDQVIWNSLPINITADIVITLNLKCVDSSNATDTSSLSVIVGLPGASPPVFSTLYYSKSLLENATIGTTVLTVSATSKLNNTLRYSLVNISVIVPFEINPLTGDITLTDNLNYEDISQYSFIVMARDLNDSTVALANVQFTILDINDNSPVLSPSIIPLLLPENAETGVAYAKYICTDEDANNVIAYALQLDSSPLPFSIDATGFIVLNSSLDYELRQTYNITVICSDDGAPPLSDMATLYVDVTGINEYSPQFSMDDYNFTVNENATLTSVVGSVHATDDDLGRNGMFYYADYGGSGSTHFLVNDTSGDILVKSHLNASVADELSLTIAAIDYGPTTSFVSTTNVELSIADVNERPYFDKVIYTVFENAVNLSSGDTLTTITCYDHDIISSNANVTLEIVTNPAPHNISLASNATGQGFVSIPLILNNELSAGSYNLIIQCKDHGSPQLAQNVTVVIVITAVNTPPTFDESVYGLSVNEDTPMGSDLLIVNATDLETGVTYAMTGGTGFGTFGINVDTGTLTLLGTLDYETTQNYLLTVSAIDKDPLNPLTATTQISVVVVNVNDHRPIISPSTYSTIRDEGTYENDTIRSFTCTDPDGGTTNMVASPSSLFTIDTTTNSLILNGVVDYEVSTSLKATIVCNDYSVAGADSGLSSTAVISISVSPVNFDAPIVISPSIVNISEGSEILSIITNISAYDPDLRGSISYTTDSYSNLFSLDPNSGNLILLQTLDRESIDRYELTIVISDNDNVQSVTPKESTQNLTLLITDINDHSPSCDVSLSSIILQANTYNNFVSLFSSSCYDMDIGINSELVYLLDEGTIPSEGVFNLNNVTGSLNFTGTITKSSSGSVIIITVSDMGINPISIPTTIKLILTVLTGDEPQFDPNYFNVTISENHPPLTVPILNGTILRNALINADGSSVHYNFIDNTTDFIIDGSTGSIFLLSGAILDYDEGPQKISLGIQATINTDKAEAILDVYLTDYNDNSPIFTQQVYNGTVMENLSPGQSVLTVSASDIDSGLNGVIRYSIVSGITNFQINSKSGVITTLSYFDREIISSYSITVQATDQGSPSQSSTATVLIAILDENDNEPVFPSQQYNLLINDLTMPGYVLHTFTASDMDTTGSIRYSLVTSSSFLNDFLLLNPFNGELSLKIDVPSDHEFEYSFKVSANDEIHTTETNVIIRIATLSTTSISMLENEDDQTYDVYNFLQLSLNLSSNAVYTIISGDLYEQFDMLDDGILTNVELLDRENISSYSLEISAVDNTTNENGILRLEIDVADVNDNPPIFESSVYMFNISEGHYPFDTLIGVVTATDADKPSTENSRITYNLNVHPQSNLFTMSLNPVTGELSVSGLLDRETAESYYINIRARDHGEPTPYFTYADVYVYLIDINDNSPRFSVEDVSSFVILFDENSPSGSFANSVISLRPFGPPVVTDALHFSDPDISDSVSVSLSGSVNVTLLSDDSPAYFVSDGEITSELNNTEFEITISDGEHDVTKDALLLVIELQPSSTIMTTSTSILATSDVTATPSVSATPIEPTNFFNTPLGISILIVGSVMVFAICFFFVCISIFSYQYYRKKKDHDKRRPTSVFKRVVSGSQRKHNNYYSDPEGYLNHDFEFDPLDYSNYAAYDQSLSQLYGEYNEVETEFTDGGIMPQHMDSSYFYGYPPPYPYGMPSTFGHAPVSPQTSTSEVKHITDSTDEDESPQIFHKYKIGPLLESVLEDFERGNELLKEDMKTSRNSLKH
jgi:protocadherin Fat 4